MSFPATDCARARESVSAQLDGELPELELDRLETHLLICPACTAWAEEVRDVTWRLREAGSRGAGGALRPAAAQARCLEGELRCGSRIGGGRGRDGVRRPRTAAASAELAAVGAASVGPRKRHGAALCRKPPDPSRGRHVLAREHAARHFPARLTSARSRLSAGVLTKLAHRRLKHVTDAPRERRSELAPPSRLPVRTERRVYPMHRRVWFLAAAAGRRTWAGRLRCRDDGREELELDCFVSSCGPVCEGVGEHPAHSRRARGEEDDGLRPRADGHRLQPRQRGLRTRSTLRIVAGTPVIRGTYIINNKGKYLLDMASKVDGHEEVPHDQIRRTRTGTGSATSPSRSRRRTTSTRGSSHHGPGQQRRVRPLATDHIARAKAHGKKQVTFFWKKGRRSRTTATCSATSTRASRSRVRSSTTTGTTASAVTTATRSRTARSTCPATRRARA